MTTKWPASSSRQEVGIIRCSRTGHVIFTTISHGTVMVWRRRPTRTARLGGGHTPPSDPGPAILPGASAAYGEQWCSRATRANVPAPGAAARVPRSLSVERCIACSRPTGGTTLTVRRSTMVDRVGADASTRTTELQGLGFELSARHVPKVLDRACERELDNRILEA